jgi:two-component sensor histidine kinase
MLQSSQYEARVTSLPIRLAVLVAGTTLPLILFAAGLVYERYTHDYEAASQRVLESVRGIRLVLDRDVQALTSGLSVLALSQPLQRDDINAFRLEVQAFRSQFGGSVLSLADRAGRQFINTQAADNAELPARNNMDNVLQVFATGRPAYSRVFKGAVSGNLLLAVDVPVFRNEKVVYTLAATLPLASLQSLIERQRPNAAWTVAMFDQEGINFARVPNPESTIGKSASPSLRAALFDREEAELITTSLEGTELITAFTRSPLSGWTVAAGIPRASITGPLWRTLAVTAAIGVVLLSIGLVFALRMAGQIARGEALHGLLVDELNHRVKNTLSTVQSVAHQTFRGEAPPAVIGKYDGRLAALGRAHNVLSNERWASAEVQEIVRQVLAPFVASTPERLRTSGPSLRVNPSCALMLSMVLHELATNAVKYGALSESQGQVSISWERHPGTPPLLKLRWMETGGPAVAPPTRKGFGSRLIERTFVSQLGGRVSLDFAQSGVVALLECPFHEREARG